MSAFIQNRWLKWGSVLFLAALILGAVYSYEALYISKVKAAYTIANSARFIPGNSDYLSRTPGSSGNQQKWTFSFWAKFADFSNTQSVISACAGASGEGVYTLFNNTSSQLTIGLDTGGVNYQSTTNAQYRDPAAWLNFVIAVDTTQATAANRLILYVNGVPQTWSSYNAPPQNTNTPWNRSGITHCIGQYGSSIRFYNGYLADVYNIDGQQLPPTCFGALDTNGYWRPSIYNTASPCAAYGTNGFHLDFSNGSSLGTDVSGNGNNFTVNNLASTDQVLDSPTNSFATFNPLCGSDLCSNGTFSAGNLAMTTAGKNGAGSIASKSGKWYFEATYTTASTGSYIGVRNFYSGAGIEPIYFADGTTGSLTGNPSFATYTTGDVIGVAFDIDNNQISFYKNGTLQGTGNYTVTTTMAGQLMTSEAKVGSGGAGVWTMNFGQGGQSGLTFDSASGGSFKYTPPSGYKALSTANLPAPAITVPKNYFDAVTYAGNGSTQSITGSTTIVSFTTTGTTAWTAPIGVTSVQYLVVGGGGGGGENRGGGGGAGGMLTGTLAVTPGSAYTVVVGAGGTGAPSGSATLATNGGNSQFGSITALGGGYGSGANSGGGGNTGGSGGGGVGDSGLGGSGTAGQGNAGGNGDATNGSVRPAGGGGGAGAAGGNGSGTVAGNGGTGVASSISGSSVTYAGGGGGGDLSCGTAGSGGTGGGGAGNCNGTGSSGTANTGGGGGGGGGNVSNGGGDGGSGIVIISYQTTIGFAPDLAWIKDRTTTNAHGIFDSVRGTTQSFTNTGTSTWTASAALTSVQYLVVGGGGGGGSNRGGGGGAGGMLTGTLTVTPGSSYSVVVGAGGVGAVNAVSPSTQGGQSVFSSITALGGGYGGSPGVSPSGCGTGGSGGGNTDGGTGCAGTAGQGNNGGDGFPSGSRGGGGGGGASAVGANGTTAAGGNGGAGTASSLSGSSVTYAGGGGGSVLTSGTDGTGGAGGGGSGQHTTTGSSGTANTGGGGGGGGSDGVTVYSGGVGGSGIVILANSGGSISFPYWSSNSNAAETNSLTAITGFLTNGFSIGSSSLFNTSGNNYVSWLWKKSPTTDGVSVVTYTGDGTSNRGIAHGISSACSGAIKMFIIKDRSAANDPYVWHAGLTSGDYFLKLDSSAAQSNSNTPFHTSGATPDCSNIYVSYNATNPGTNTNGDAYVAYIFKQIDGFSAFGTYTGNAAADGPFVYTGFKPRFILLKNTSSVNDWYIYDTARDTFNPLSRFISPDTTGADTSTAYADALVNGFKVRSSNAAFNASANTYIYAAFADVPFKYSASPANLAFVQAVAFLLGMTF